MSTSRSKMNKSIVLRICKADMTTYNGFIWPEKGYVEAPDWEATQECGNGLHGWFEAQGDASHSSYLNEPGAKYLVLKVKTDSIIHLDGKCKFPRAKVCFVGNRNEAIAYIEEHYPHLQDSPLLFASRKANDCEIATAGDYGTAVAGKGGTAVSRYKGTSVAGQGGIAKSGFHGTSIAGDYGIAMVDNHGTAISGFRGTSIAGAYGAAMAGIKGIIHIEYFYGEGSRLAIGYIGIDGLKPDVKYVLDTDHTFVEEEIYKELYRF